MTSNITTSRRLKLETQGLYRTCMPHADNSTARTAVTLFFVSVWAVITAGLAFEAIATVEPPFYGLFTAVVFLLVGRMWNIEVQRLLPGE